MPTPETWTKEQRAGEWFTSLERDAPLQQGDVFLRVVLREGYPGFDLVTLTQTCDLVDVPGQRPVPLVLLAPCTRLPDFLERNPNFVRDGAGGLEAIRKGHQPLYYVLPSCEFLDDVSQRRTRIVEFDAMFTVSFATVRGWTEKGQRGFSLNSPYREDVGQAVAKYFMRVALDASIASFKGLVPAGTPKSTPYQSGSQPWGNLPILKVDVEIEIRVLAHELAGDRLVLAHLKHNGKPTNAIGCGSDESRAMLSLERQISEGHLAFVENHESSQKWAWLGDILTWPGAGPSEAG